jgi:hypothetical protein
MTPAADRTAYVAAAASRRSWGADYAAGLPRIINVAKGDRQVYRFGADPEVAFVGAAAVLMEFGFPKMPVSSKLMEVATIPQFHGGNRRGTFYRAFALFTATHLRRQDPQP